MARQKFGPLGNATGKLAHLVYFEKNSNGHIRLAPQRKAALSALQLDTNSKFALMQSFLGKVSSMVSKGYLSKKTTTTPLNEAFSVNVKEAIIGTSPNFSIDYDKVTLTKGPLHRVSSLTASVTDTSVEFTWFYNPQYEQASDKFSVLVVNLSKDAYYLFDWIAQRGVMQASIALPPDFEGDELLTWSCFQNEMATQVSNSSFLRIQL